MLVGFVTTSQGSLRASRRARSRPCLDSNWLEGESKGIGETKNSNSWSLSSTRLDLNRCPRIGMLPSKGTCVDDLDRVVTVTPPNTTVPPSGTRTCVFADWVLML